MDKKELLCFGQEALFLYMVYNAVEGETMRFLKTIFDFKKDSCQAQSVHCLFYTGSHDFTKSHRL